MDDILTTRTKVYATEDAAARRVDQLYRAGIFTGYTRTEGGWRLLHDPADVELPHRPAVRHD